MNDPPPILKSVEDLLLEYLTTPENLPIHDYKRNQEFWPRKPNPKSLFEYDYSPLSTTLKVERDLNTGEITQFHEVTIQGAGNTARNSMQLTRAPMSSPDESLRGSSSNYPFWPGGFPDPVKDLHVELKTSLSNDLLSIPPGFKRGLLFETDGITVRSEDSVNVAPKLTQNENIVNFMDILDDHDFLGIWESSQQTKNDEVDKQNEMPNLPEEEGVIPKEIPVLNISKPSKPISSQGTEWAILLDTTKPVTDFRERLPHMAIEYEFELDTFQKLAILQLEKHNHVFVAAHTSAGKTVVAEYAIALSQKHMTRTIYTSPIKALSNQKYRDFKNKFQDVGLVTGDFQINIKASCLIMTTEILRSMLFGGSEVTRDLEYVIFDEVHYINDKDRGHVWEQVLIMLPEHVCVVLLSATVPNTIEFADWLGRTYKKKVYVVTTYKRPVPLQHYLYTGTGGSTRDNRYLILSAEGKFSLEGYVKAQESLKKPKEKKPEKENSKPTKRPQHQYKPDRSNQIDYNKQTRTMWDGLVSHLLAHKLLPVVAFTFSRQKCDTYAELLMHLDLTTETEKFHIKKFFEKCVKSLKPPDREVPQIVKMQRILIQGIGVHHSGILPIVKEMIEMLFQQQLVKLLFATETFAMGVNMPARTVVFDSITKHDGIERRNLKPAEYIQMAGRAGRRGLDETGTVIMLCRGEVPVVSSFQEMMLGKPSVLQSQFRITYGMVLSLLRVESLSVEGIISRSFREADHQKRQENIRKQLSKVEKDLSAECSRELSDYMQPLIKFYDAASAYLQARTEVFPEIMKSPRITKEMVPGRVLLITHKSHINKLALLLNSITKSLHHTYKVLVLSNKETNTEVPIKSDMWYKMLTFAQNQVFCPEGTADHYVLTITPLDIFEITSKVIKVDTDLVLKDWDKRQIARFRNDPPGQTFNLALQELYNLSLNTLNKNQYDHSYLDFIQDLKLNELVLHEQKTYLNRLKDIVLEYATSTQIPNFEEQFSVVFSKKSLEDRKRDLQFQQSYASLSLYPELEKRVDLLHQLNYVDEKNKVELKGKVACEMGSNELLITELVVRNVLAHFQPAEVAALLSSLVFQAKTYVEPVLTPELLKGKEAILRIYGEITELEHSVGVHKISETSKEPNFGLTEVVYEWARSKPFAEIMLLTDIQEGIIVRCIQQLNETICDVRNAARITGDSKFQNKMEEASAAIKRDIVFAESLYTTNENLVL